MKATKAQTQARVEEVLRIRLDGAEVWDLREYVREKELEPGSVWELPPGGKPLSDNQLWRYLAKADQFIAESCRASRKKLLRCHLAQRRNLYAKAVSSGDYRTALALLRDEAELQGIYPPKKIAPTTPDGGKPYGPSMTRRELLQSLPFLPATARATLDRLLTGKETPADRLWADPRLILTQAGMRPDPWQRQVLRSRAPRTLLLCSRHAGKSLTAAALALRTALLEAPALVLLLSPTERQSGELFKDKVLRLYNALGRPVPAVQESAVRLTLANGSRVLALPGKEESVRCYSSVALLVVDEASRVVDSLYRSIRPMLAVSRGRLAALSTPFGKRGWFYEAWAGAQAWDRVRIRADECPRITPEFLAEERRALGERWYRQEYECSFEDTIDALFSSEDIAAALNCDVQPLTFG
jgi:hypothetical protein